MSRAGSFDLDEATARLAAATSAERLGLPVIGLGWATVDTDRAVGELTRAVPDAAPFEPGFRTHSSAAAACSAGDG